MTGPAFERFRASSDSGLKLVTVRSPGIARVPKSRPSVVWESRALRFRYPAGINFCTEKLCLTYSYMGM
jgi:hypothetical protein